MISRMQIFLGLTIYLFLAAVGCTAILAFYLNPNTPQSSAAEFSLNDSGFSVAGSPVSSNKFGDIKFMSGVGNLFPYVWIGSLFVVIPFAAWVIIGISLFFPTGNAGG